jgi:hypothetical protein
MEVEYNNFIGKYTDVFPENFCQHVISEFERLKDLGAGTDRLSNGTMRHLKDDFQLELSLPNFYSKLGLNLNAEPTRRFEDKPLLSYLITGLQICFESYVEKYSVLHDQSLRSSFFKCQRTDPGQGYHLWHHEKGNSFESATRGLVYSVYLNSLEVSDGGETEFLYLKERIRPVENSVIIWPASFTHAHRGNTVLGNKSKYIVTGWFNYNAI